MANKRVELLYGRCIKLKKYLLAFLFVTLLPSCFEADLSEPQKKPGEIKDGKKGKKGKKDYKFDFRAILTSKNKIIDPAKEAPGYVYSRYPEVPLVELKIGQEYELAWNIVDKDDQKVPRDSFLVVSAGFNNISLIRNNTIRAIRRGLYTVFVSIPYTSDEIKIDKGKSGNYWPILVKINPSDVAKVKIVPFKTEPYVHSRMDIELLVTDKLNNEVGDYESEFKISPSASAKVDDLGNLQILQAGKIEILAKVYRKNAPEVFVEDRFEFTAKPSIVASMRLDADKTDVHTGEVIHFTAQALDKHGKTIEGFPIQYSSRSDPNPLIFSPGASAQINKQGTFVAERSGTYTISAMAGDRYTSMSVKVRSRNVQHRIEILGNSNTIDHTSSDLWIFTGVDGRNYAALGSHAWDGGGRGFIFDVNDPQEIQQIAELKFDARVINDVKVTADGKIAIFSREGASDRKNGIIFVDVEDPKNPKILSHYTDQLTGGVHNMFINGRHLYVLSDSIRFDVLDFNNPKKPVRIGRFELNTESHYIHDVWVLDDIAYTANWRDGIVVTDVGGAGKGGSPKKPVFLGQWKHVADRIHAVFPYRSKSTGKRYIFAGDEAFPYSNPVRSYLKGRKLKKLSVFPENELSDPRLKAHDGASEAGWVHILEADDWNNLKEVAHYRVPERGSHNIWVEDDIMYIGYYSGGLRVVDVSGELQGDLYAQGREMSKFLPRLPYSKKPNIIRVWGAQPHKGVVFLSEMHSGLWAVKMHPGNELQRALDTLHGFNVLGEPQ